MGDMQQYADGLARRWLLALLLRHGAGLGDALEIVFPDVPTDTVLQYLRDIEREVAREIEARS